MKRTFIFLSLFLIFIQSNFAQNQQDTTIYTFAEEGAEPLIGTPKFLKAYWKAIKYPKSAKRMGLDSKVYIQFVVEKDGNCSSFKVIRSLHPEIDKACLEALKNLCNSEKGKWKPAQIDGKFVRLRFILPIIIHWN